MFSPEEFKSLCDQAQANNMALGVTGLLLKNSREFLQCLEGRDEAVMDIFEKISADPRHFDIHVIEVKRNQERLFEQWSMFGVDCAQGQDCPPQLAQCKSLFQLSQSNWSRKGLGLVSLIYEHHQVYDMLKKRGEEELLTQVLPYLHKVG